MVKVLLAVIHEKRILVTYYNVAHTAFKTIEVAGGGVAATVRGLVAVGEVVLVVCLGLW